MTSKLQRQAFVWIWLPASTKPVVAGRLVQEENRIYFNYGRSYLDRDDDVNPPVPIYDAELPLRKGEIQPLSGLSMPGCIRDASPDAWGRRVILNRLLGLKGTSVDTAQLDEMTYLLKSGSDRIGALDFQTTSDQYSPRKVNTSTLEELSASAERVEKGLPLSLELDLALCHGTSIGGARPKALLEDGTRKYVAKFSSSTDLYNVVKAEYVAMKLAYHAGLNVAPVTLTTAANKDVLLVERFDRYPIGDSWGRRMMVSALTILGLDDMMARYASYETLAEIIRHRFLNPKSTLKELFSRLVFNILCGNTDDHARNHAAFWDGKSMCLTPAYDICPQGRAGNEASQAMLIHGNHNLSQLKTCLDTAHNFLLSQEEASEIFSSFIDIINDKWDDVCDEAKLSVVDKNMLWKRQFLNPFSLER